jgi:hypothetical protein
MLGADGATGAAQIAPNRSSRLEVVLCDRTLVMKLHFLFEGSSAKGFVTVRTKGQRTNFF